MGGPLTRIFVITVLTLDLLALVYFGGHLLITGTLIPHHEEPQIVVAAAKDGKKATETVAKEPEEAPFDLATYMADPVKGQRVAAKCKACHSFDQGGAHRVGPKMWGVFGAQVAQHEDYSYSTAFQEKADMVWDQATLFAFLADPRGWAPGTKMQFNGIRKPEDRADLIAYLKTLQ